MSFLKKKMAGLAFKSLMVTVRDRATKLEAHLDAKKSLDEKVGPFGDGEKYAEQLEDAFFAIRDMTVASLIDGDRFQEAEDAVRRPFQLYRAVKHGKAS